MLNATVDKSLPLSQTARLADPYQLEPANDHLISNMESGARRKHAKAVQFESIPLQKGS